jgi:predicted heme/steroid binding protein/uncharacterized membrane protein
MTPPALEVSPKVLLESDGKNGRPVYVAVEGKVYDVTGSKLWTNGVHMGRHHAGADLTTDIQAAPHGPEMLARYPEAGTLKKEATPGIETPEMLSRLLTRFPVLRRHPHPMTVHFPIVFMCSAAMFTLLYLLTGIRGFEATAANCLGAGLLFTPAAIATGYYTWWLNYSARPMRPVTIKQRLSMIMLGVNVAAFAWRSMAPDILASPNIWSLLYVMLLFSLVILVAVVGWFGASLTFPVEK